MKITNILLAIIAILLVVNCYLAYHSALVYGLVPYEKMDAKAQAACATDVNSSECPREWHLNGTDSGIH